MIEALIRSLITKLEPDYFENPYCFYQPHTEADLTAAKNDLKYEPEFPPAKGIADYVKLLESY